MPSNLGPTLSSLIPPLSITYRLGRVYVALDVAAAVSISPAVI